MTSLKELRKATSLTSLSDAVAKMNEKSNYGKDLTEYWKPTTDKAGNGYAVIRFLPTAPADLPDGLPWVRIWYHGFKGPNGWYIENSRTTINQPDHLSELNTKLWNSGIDEYKKIVQGNAKDQSIRKRKLKIVSNILVIEDEQNPESVGKIFKYEYGKKIWTKIENAMHPEFKDEKPFNPFDFEEGANFKLKIKRVEGYSNYDASVFETPSALFNGNEKLLEEIWNKQYSLKTLIAPSAFKTYDQLKDRLRLVLGDDDIAYTLVGNTNNNNKQQNDNSVQQSSNKPASSVVKERASPTPVVDSVDDDDDDADLERFKKFAA